MKLELMSEKMASITTNEFSRIHTYINQGLYKGDWLVLSKQNEIRGEEPFLFQCAGCGEVYSCEFESEDCCGVGYV